MAAEQTVRYDAWAATTITTCTSEKKGFLTFAKIERRVHRELSRQPANAQAPHLVHFCRYSAKVIFSMPAAANNTTGMLAESDHRAACSAFCLAAETVCLTKNYTVRFTIIMENANRAFPIKLAAFLCASCSFAARKHHMHRDRSPKNIS